LIGLLAAVAALAATFGVGSWSPYPSGALLALLVASQAIAGFALAVHYVHARIVALVAALFAVAWSAWDAVVLSDVTWFELALLAVGLLEALFVAGCTPRDTGDKPRRWRGSR
jgi:hypothetical protein